MATTGMKLHSDTTTARDAEGADLRTDWDNARPWLLGVDFGEDFSDDTIAMRAPEFEDITLRDIEFPGERFAKQTLRTEVSRPHRGLRNAKGLGGFLDAELFDGTKREHDAKILWQCIELRFEQCANLLAAGELIGQIVCGIGHDVDLRG